MRSHRSGVVGNKARAVRALWAFGLLLLVAAQACGSGAGEVSEPETVSTLEATADGTRTGLTPEDFARSCLNELEAAVLPVATELFGNVDLAFDLDGPASCHGNLAYGLDRSLRLVVQVEPGQPVPTLGEWSDWRDRDRDGSYHTDWLIENRSEGVWSYRVSQDSITALTEVFWAIGQSNDEGHLLVTLTAPHAVHGPGELDALLAPLVGELSGTSVPAGWKAGPAVAAAEPDHSSTSSGAEVTAPEQPDVPVGPLRVGGGSADGSIRGWDFDTIDATAWCNEIGTDLAAQLPDWTGFERTLVRAHISGRDGYYSAVAGSRHGDCGWSGVGITGLGSVDVWVEVYDVPTTAENYIERWYDCCSPRGGDALVDTVSGRRAAFARSARSDFTLRYLPLDNVALGRPQVTVIGTIESGSVGEDDRYPAEESVLIDALVELYGSIELTPEALDVPPMVGAVPRTGP